ncbi:MAG: RNA polymerase sigma factor, partial [Planctomycetota bacterium]
MDPSLQPEALLEQHEWVRNLAHRLVRDPHAAEDVAQQAWVKVLQRPPGRLESLKAWLATVVRNCARDRFRSDGRRSAREQAAPPPVEPRTADELVAHAEAQRRVLDAVLELEPTDRDLVLMRFFDGLEPREIADRLGVPGGTVRSRLHRALARVRERLDGAHDGDRRAWVVALLGPEAWEALSGTVATATTAGAGTSSWKGLVTMTTNTKIAAGAAAVVLAGVLFWQMSGAGEPVMVPDVEVADAAPALAAVPEDLAAVPADEAPEKEKETAEEPAAPTSEGPVSTMDLDVKIIERLVMTVLSTSEGETVEDTARRKIEEALAEKAGDEGWTRVTAGGGGFGMMSPTGERSKWHPVPEKGTVTLKGRVLDRLGNPLAGAVIQRLDPGAIGDEGDVVSFRHIKGIGKTDDRGRFEIPGQPARVFRLQGNYLRTMHR